MQLQCILFYYNYKLLNYILEIPILTNKIGSVGLLDQNGFNFTTLVPSNSSTNPLPLKIKIGGFCFGKNLDITLSQVTGNISLVKSKVFTQTSNNGDIVQSLTNVLVIIKKYFFS
jgi:hypothetical protein